MRQTHQISQNTNNRYRFGLICIGLASAIIAVYWPVYRYDFVNYDDSDYVTNNVNIQSGLNKQSIVWAFTSNYTGNWHPVTWLSLTIDYQLFKNWAGGYHIENVLFHIANTIILFYILILMTGAIWPSAFVAGAFALHPLHVESVAWIAERKDVLSAFFSLLTIWAYARYCRSTAGVRYYLSAIVFFILALMSKSMPVTIPLVLLLLDFWPLERKIWRRLLIEKIPFFICALAACVETVLVQQSINALSTYRNLEFKYRIENAIVSYATYIVKMIWPSGLTVLYPHPGNRLSLTKVAVCGLALLLISIYLLRKGRRDKFPAVGWLWYVVMLVPVIGIVQSGSQGMADRYTYMTLTGLFIIIAWGAKKFVQKRFYKITAIAAIIILTISAITSRGQLKYWQNTKTLFEHSLQVTKNNYIMLNYYGVYLGDSGELDKAVSFFNESLKINPRFADAHNNLAVTLAKMGKDNEAIGQYEEALKLKPNYPESQDGLGCALLKTDNIPAAIEHFRLAIKYDPKFSAAYRNLGIALFTEGKNEEAIGQFEQAVKINPKYTEAYLNLGVTSMKLKKFDKAIESFNKAIELEPDNVTAHGGLGLALAEAGRNDEAIKEIRFVLNVKPKDAVMYRHLGNTLEKQGKIADAIEAYRTALKIDPNNTTTKQLLDEALKNQKGH